MAFIKHQLLRAIWAGYFLGRKHERNRSEYPRGFDDCMRLVAEEEAADEIQRELGIYSARERAYQEELAGLIQRARQERQAVSA
jgi:hypothetical protein